MLVFMMKEGVLEKAVYQKAEDIYDDGCIRLPFSFEVLAIPIIEGSEEWNIIGGVNYSTSVNNSRYFLGRTYRHTTKFYRQAILCKS